MLRQLAARSLRLVPPLNRFVLTTLAEREARRAFADPQAPPVLVYQMGKVGSGTVYTALHAAGLSDRVLHVHFLSEELPAHIESQARAGLDPPPYHFLVSRAARERLSDAPGTHCQIISLVRDPIAFEISNLFENPHIGGARAQRDPKAFLEQELSRPGAFGYVNEWFDRELAAVFGIDVFAEPFPTDRGFATYRGTDADALVIRLEDLNEHGPMAIAEFLGLPAPLTLATHNARAGSRWYSRIRDSVRLSRETCERVYAERLPSHFYSADQLAAFTDRWTRKRT